MMISGTTMQNGEEVSEEGVEVQAARSAANAVLLNEGFGSLAWVTHRPRDG